MKAAAAILLLAAASGACARPATPQPSARCDLTVRFGSYAMGIDRAALAAVRVILADRDVRSVEDRRWGKEGELTLCARTSGMAAAERLFRRIGAALPKTPRGPITLSTASGLKASVPPRR